MASILLNQEQTHGKLGGREIHLALNVQADSVEPQEYFVLCGRGSFDRIALLNVDNNTIVSPL